MDQGMNTLDQGGIRSNGNKGALHTNHISRTEASPSDAV